MTWIGVTGAGDGLGLGLVFAVGDAFRPGDGLTVALATGEGVGVGTS